MVNQIAQDPRYSMHNTDQKLILQEWRVQNENGVATILKSLPSFRTSIGRDPEFKNRKHLQFATRNTIPWRLECELDGKSRQDGMNQFSLTMQVDQRTSDQL